MENTRYKFRAWHKATQLMDDVVLIDFYNEKIGILYADPVMQCESIQKYNFNEVELMQSTGLFDKNGVEVFEGDVIIDHLLNDKNGEYFAVVKCDNYFYLKMIRHGIICNNIIDPMMFNQHTHLNGVEVVGNIYKDSEFLEVE